MQCIAHKSDYGTAMLCVCCLIVGAHAAACALFACIHLKGERFMQQNNYLGQEKVGKLLL